MTTLTLQTWSDSNMAGDEWEWVVFANQRADGSWSIGARQFDQITGRGAGRLKGSYRLKTGRQVKDALDKIFGYEEFMDVEPDWDSIVDQFMAVDNQLGLSIRIAVDEDDDDDLDEDYEESDAQKLYSTALMLVSKSQWPRSKSRGAGGVGYAIENAKLSRPIIQYILNYVANNQRFPVGSHIVEGGMEVIFADGFNDPV